MCVITDQYFEKCFNIFLIDRLSQKFNISILQVINRDDLLQEKP